MSFFNRIKANKVIKAYAEKSIIIFSEGNIYYTTNKPIIDELIKSVDVLYITIDKDDKLLDFSHEKFHPVYLEFDFWGQLLMATIKGKLLITTTPSLDVLALKKSPNMRHYSYFMHSPTDIHYYQKNSFDYFDSVVCIGDFQIESINILESKRNTPVKEKVVIGLPYYDLYSQEYEKYECEENTVLIAPSWGSNNFLNNIDYDIFEIVLQAGYNVIFRPHPMSFKYEKNLLENILKKYNNSSSFSLDSNTSPVEAIAKSKLMISAYSGMVIDYVILSNKPLFLFNSERKIDNLENSDLDTISWDDKLIKDKAIIINSKEELENALNTLSSKPNNKVDNKSDIQNIGTTSNKIAEYYIYKFQGL